MNELYNNLQQTNQPNQELFTGTSGKQFYEDVSYLSDALKSVGVDTSKVGVAQQKSEELLQKSFINQAWNLLLSGLSFGLVGSVPEPETAKKSGNLLYQDIDIPFVNWLYKTLISPYGLSIAGLTEGAGFVAAAGPVGKVGLKLTKTTLGLGEKALTKVGAGSVVDALARRYQSLSPGMKNVARKMAENAFVFSLLGAGHKAKQQFFETGETPSLGERLKTVGLEYLNPFTYVGAGIATGLDIGLGSVLAGRAAKQLEGVLGREIPISERLRNYFDTGSYVESSIPKIKDVIKVTPVNNFTYKSVYETLKKEPIIYSENIKPAIDSLRAVLPEKVVSQLDIKLDSLKSFFDEVVPTIPAKDLVRYFTFRSGGISKLSSFIEKVADKEEQASLRRGLNEIVNWANGILDNTAKMFNLVLENSNKFNFEGININRLKEIFNINKAELTIREIQAKKSYLESLNEQLKKTTDLNEKNFLLRQIGELKNEINRLDKEGVVNYAVIDTIPLIQKQMVLNAILSNPSVVGKMLKGTQFEMLLKERLDLLNKFDTAVSNFANDFVSIIPRYDSNAFIKLISNYKNNPEGIFGGTRALALRLTPEQLYPRIKEMTPAQREAFLRVVEGKIDEATIGGEIKSKPTEVPETINQSGDMLNTAVGAVNEIIGNAPQEVKESFKNISTVLESLDKMATTPEKILLANKIKDIVNKKIEDTGLHLRPQVTEKIKNIYDPLGERTIANNVDIKNLDNLISGANKQEKLSRVFEFLSYGDIDKYDTDAITSALLRLLTNSDEHLKFVSRLLDDSVDKADIYKFVHGEIIKGLGDAIKKDSPSTYLSIKGKYSSDKYGELIDYFKSKATPFKSAEKSVGELTVDKSFLNEVSKSLNEEPITPKVEQVKPEVSTQSVPQEIKVSTRKMPSMIRGAGEERVSIKDHPEIYTDKYLLLEDRNPQEVTRWQEKQKPSYSEPIDYSRVKELYPQKKTTPVKFLGFEQSSFKGRAPVAHLDVGKETSIAINAEYYQWLKKEGYIIKSTGDEMKPLVLERGGKDVGLLMPITGMSKPVKSFYKATPEVKQAAPEPKEATPIKESKLSPDKEKIINDFYQNKYNKVVNKLKSKFYGNIEKEQITEADVEDAVSEVITGIISGNYPIKGNIAGLVFDSSKKKILNKIKTNSRKISLEKPIEEGLTLGDTIKSPEKSEFDLNEFVDKFLAGLKNLSEFSIAEKKEILNDFEKILRESSAKDLSFDKQRNIEILGKGRYGRLLRAYDLIFNKGGKK